MGWKEDIEAFPKVEITTGDGELYEGSVWEAIMFAGHHKIDNLFMIIDKNKPPRAVRQLRNAS